MKHILKVFIFLMLIVFFACGEQNNYPVFHQSHEPKKQNAPFSDAVETQDLLFLSGQIGMDHSTRTLVEGGIQTETLQTIKNIEAVLLHHELELKDVIKCTVILSDINDFAAFNEIYIQYFKQKPARTTFAASGLAANAKIEIEVVAVKR
ncbi:RidA family protein [Paucihalobacter ruber]|uniref:RidA family protein n=1 Tax=Paucihalobacter ruber TaxID=2567861 RepID=A0A506PKS2_9FLAO|nr:Rid family detoxifying hydrolase [Paucihalobacter ruber]TPV34118.1 RidA family protein [Paucihalobacter ruber]